MTHENNHPRDDLFGTTWAWFRHDRTKYEDQYLAPIDWSLSPIDGPDTELMLAYVKIEYGPRSRDEPSVGWSKPDFYRPFLWDAKRKAYRSVGRHRTMADAKDAIAASLTDHKGRRPIIERPLRTIKETANADQ